MSKLRNNVNYDDNLTEKDECLGSRIDTLLVREVNLHELLEVEKGEVVILVHLEELA